MARFAGVATVLVAAAMLAGCAKSLPDASGFADRTVRLREANRAELDALSDRHTDLVERARLRMSEHRLTPEAFDDYRKLWEGHRRRFDALARSIDKVLAQAVDYTEELADLSEAGRTGKKAAQSLMESLGGFSAPLGAPALGALPGVGAAVEALAEAQTRSQASKSLKAALEVAQPAVDAVVEALLAAYDDTPPAPLISIAEGLAQQAILEARLRVGANRLQFCAVVERFDDAYYGHALGILISKNGDASNWRGFCPGTAGTPPADCRSLLELEAFRALRELDRAARPDCLAYREEAESLRAWLAQRRKKARSMRSALRAWNRAHQKLLLAWEEESDFRASDLDAVLEALNRAAGDFQ